MKLLGLSTLSVFVLEARSMAVPGDAAATLKPRATWNSLGCYIDNVSGRALPNGVSVPGGSGAMTNAACQSACQTQGYSYAGTEYAGECFCGNSVVNGGGPAPDGNAGCNMKCNGNSGEICGGPNRLTMFQLSNGGTNPPPSSDTRKRGLCYNNDNPSKDAVYANLFKGFPKVTWAYDWGFPKYNLDASLEFVPMLWGAPSGSYPQWTAAVQTPGTKSILGFNEPDLTYSASSNIPPVKAADGYKTYMQPFAGSVRISMPNVLWNNYDGASSGGNYNSRVWTKNFLDACNGCHFDFAPIHYYQDCFPASGQSGIDWFKSNITDAYNTLKLPLWITEFECYGNEQQQIAWLQQVMPWLDQQNYVERYAYFGTFPGYLINGAGNGLSALGQAYATI